jgi:DNA-binding response OmpR family regulator
VDASSSAGRRPWRAKRVRLLLVEDSPRLQRSLATGLRKEGYAVDVAGDGSNGLWYATHHVYDVIVLDLMLPGIDGLTLLKKLRDSGAAHADAHVLILTARDAVADRVAGLRAGADDYLVKPFAFEELLARVQALTRRQHRMKNPVLRVDDLRVDTSAKTATRGGRSIDLSSREFALLELLALRQGEVISRPEIEAHLYDENAEPMSNVIDAAVYSLRKKIDTPGRPSLIQTRRGIGYVMGANDASAATTLARSEEAR